MDKPAKRRGGVISHKEQNMVWLHEKDLVGKKCIMACCWCYVGTAYSLGYVDLLQIRI